jgi:hypothetical protein
MTPSRVATMTEPTTSNPTPTLTDECRHVRQVREQRDIAKGVYDAFDAEYKEAHGHLLERFKEEDNHGVKTDKVHFVPSYTRYATIEDRAEFLTWATQHHPELVELKEITGRLNEIVRECDDDGRALPPGLGIYKKEFVSQRAA